MEKELMASWRDASDFSYPGRATKYHAIVEDERGFPVLACGSGHPIMEMAEPASGLTPSEKCNKPGCRKAFAAADPTPKEPK